MKPEPTIFRALRYNRNPAWSAVLWAQRRKGIRKYGQPVDDNPGDAAYWAGEAVQEGADGVLYALRVSDTGHPIRGRLAAFLFALAARLLLPIHQKHERRHHVL